VGGNPTFTEAKVSGEVAPIPVVRVSDQVDPETADLE
jgi:hypothetical protein